MLPAQLRLSDSAGLVRLLVRLGQRARHLRLKARHVLRAERMLLAANARHGICGSSL